MNKSVQVMASKRKASSEAAEWIYLLAMAKEAGIPIEAVRSFFQGKTAPETKSAMSKVFVSGSIQEEEEETSSILLREHIFRRNL